MREGGGYCCDGAVRGGRLSTRAFLAAGAAAGSPPCASEGTDVRAEVSMVSRQSK